MTNPEIRRVARKKCLAKGLSPMMALAYLPNLVNILHRLYDQEYGTTWTQYWTLFLGTMLLMTVAEAGAARVSLAVWRGGAARFGDFLAYVRDWRLFLRSLAVSVWVVGLPLAVSTGLGLLVGLIPVFGLVLLPLTLLIAVLSAPLGMLYYAMEIREGENLFRTLLMGTGWAIRGVWRVIGMSIAIFWWVYLPTVVAAVALINSPIWLMFGVLSLVALAGWLFLGGYYRVSLAALALELFPGDGAAACLTPEELKSATKENP